MALICVNLSIGLYTNLSSIRKSLMLSFFRQYVYFLLLCIVFCMEQGRDVFAASDSSVAALSRAERLSLAKDFVSRLSGKVDTLENVVPSEIRRSQLDGFQDGVVFLLQPFFKESRIRLDDYVTAEVSDETLLISLIDFVSVLNFAIDVDGSRGVAQGWFLREGRRFSLDMEERTVVTPDGEFRISDQAYVSGQDI